MTANTHDMPESPLTASTEDILRFAPQENFPVALRVLSRPLRQDLLALYGFARFVDNLGDDPIDASGNLRSAEDRLAALDAAEHELDLAIDGTATHEIFVRVGETARRCRLGREDFVKLIDANRLDQTKSRYETWGDLMDYCELSANPVGRIVLGIFEAAATGRKNAAKKKPASQKAAKTGAGSRQADASGGKGKAIATPENIALATKAAEETAPIAGKVVATPENTALSDKICSALQVAEHLQDIGEDYRAGRIYLPRSHWERFGCSEDDFATSVERSLTSLSLRRLVLYEAKQARQMLRDGSPLIKKLRGGQRLAMIGFVAGGYAALDSVEAAGGEVLTEQCVSTKSRQAKNALRLLVRR